jgi:UDP-glucose 4-epimerase
VPRNSIERPVFDAETNILPSVRLFQDAAGLGVKKIVYISSLAVYGNPGHVPVKEDAKLEPVSPYGVSKLAIEEYLGYFGRVQGLEYAILRPAAAYGERQSLSPDTGVVANFVYNAIRGQPLVIYGNGSAERDLLHAEDIASGVVSAAFSGEKFGVFNLGAGKGVSLNELAEKVGKISGKKLEVRRVEKSNEVQKLVCDASRAREELGWKPEIGLDEGIRRCFDAFAGKI